jgi:ribosomal protein L35
MNKRSLLIKSLTMANLNHILQASSDTELRKLAQAELLKRTTLIIQKRVLLY